MDYLTDREKRTAAKPLLIGPLMDARALYSSQHGLSTKSGSSAISPGSTKSLSAPGTPSSKPNQLWKKLRWAIQTTYPSKASAELDKLAQQTAQIVEELA